MELQLIRIARRPGYTIGKLYIAPSNSPKGEGANQKLDYSVQSALPPLGGLRGAPGASYLCDTLEPTWRDLAHGAYKIRGCTAIPEGRYPLVITWSPKFRRWLPLIVGVPQFEGIRIHAGNTAHDTQGCILVGENRKVGMVVNSRQWEKRIVDLLASRKEGEAAWIEIKLKD